MPNIRAPETLESRKPSQLTIEMARVDHKLLQLARQVEEQIKTWQERERQAEDAHAREVARNEQEHLRQLMGKIRFGAHGFQNEADLAPIQGAFKSLQRAIEEQAPRKKKQTTKTVVRTGRPAGPQERER